MTPDERQLIGDLFERMRSYGPVDKDREAEGFINQSVMVTPDAAYKLVQSVLVQENALQEAEGRIQELEERVRQLEDAQQRQPQQSSGGGFLGGLFGGGKQAAPAPTSVPPVSNRSSGFGQAPQQRAGSPWGQGYQQPVQPQGGYAQGGYQQPMQQAPAQGGGGGFMRSAMATAAGVAGGVLAAGAIRDMMGGGSSAHASERGSSGSSQQAGEASPYEVNQQPAQTAQSEPEPEYNYQSEDDNDQGNADFGDSGGDDLDI